MNSKFNRKWKTKKQWILSN